MYIYNKMRYYLIYNTNAAISIIINIYIDIDINIDIDK